VAILEKIGVFAFTKRKNSNTLRVVQGSSTPPMLSKQDLILKLELAKFPKFRAKQIMAAIYQQAVDNYDEITTLPKELKEYLKKNIGIMSLKPVRSMVSKDGKTEKALFETNDGQKIEAVLMEFDDGRDSVCVSSQAGCQLGCKFCATGTLKFGRNLTYEEISDQVLYFAQKLHKKDRHVTNIVFMGMGEPFMNYENVMDSIRNINDPDGLNIGARHITVSTSGICEGIEKLADAKIQVNLAVSLHAPTQEIRQKIMPIAHKYPLEQLMKAIEDYIQKTNRRVSYEYVMLKNINDGEKDATALARLLKGQLCHVNLIPYNATGIQGIEGSHKNNIKVFSEILKNRGITSTIRMTMGQDIDAACGQLANKEARVKSGSANQSK
jgi:23S rRNA (adenine2503-C2)-methyltransferase